MTLYNSEPKTGSPDLREHHRPAVLQFNDLLTAWCGKLTDETDLVYGDLAMFNKGAVKIQVPGIEMSAALAWPNEPVHLLERGITFTPREWLMVARCKCADLADADAFAQHMMYLAARHGMETSLREAARYDMFLKPNPEGEGLRCGVIQGGTGGGKYGVVSWWPVRREELAEVDR